MPIFAGTHRHCGKGLQLTCAALIVMVLQQHYFKHQTNSIITKIARSTYMHYEIERFMFLLKIY